MPQSHVPQTLSPLTVKTSSLGCSGFSASIKVTYLSRCGKLCFCLLSKVIIQNSHMKKISLSSAKLHVQTLPIILTSLLRFCTRNSVTFNAVWIHLTCIHTCTNRVWFSCVFFFFLNENPTNHILVLPYLLGKAKFNQIAFSLWLLIPFSLILF